MPASVRSTYGDQLEGYDYSYPVRIFGFNAQNRQLTIAYMDVPPSGTSNGRIAMPTLLLIGGKDRTAPGSNRAVLELAATLGDYPVLAKQAAAAIPQARLVMFDRLGHSPQMEDQQAFHKALLNGLK